MVCSILLVDDVRDLRACLAKWFTMSGHRTAQAESAMEALALLAVDPLPDLVISDIMMPEMDGMEMLRTIRENPRTARVPVILLSAVDDENRVAAALAEGAAAYWVKGDLRLETMLTEAERIVAQCAAGVHEPTLATADAQGARCHAAD